MRARIRPRSGPGVRTTKGPARAGPFVVRRMRQIDVTSTGTPGPKVVETVAFWM